MAAHMEKNDESVRLYSKLMLNTVTRNYML